MASSPNFAANELVQVLVEQTFGIKSYTLKEEDAVGLEATAEIHLLEGTAVEISLTSRGYQFKGQAMVYECIEDALQAASPKYTEAKHAKLVAKLAKLAASQ